jgi:hypothetical protein
LEGDEKIKFLYFNDNLLDEKDMVYVDECLQSNNCLEELNLSGCEITLSKLKKLQLGLKNNNTLKTLYLFNNKLDDDAAKYLTNIVENSNYSL